MPNMLDKDKALYWIFAMARPLLKGKGLENGGTENERDYKRDRVGWILQNDRS
jgi:hypothetical protein